MTSQGTTMQARALLDSASFTSFITEHLAQRLRLHRKNRCVQIAGIGGALDDPSSHTVDFGVSGLRRKRDRRSPHQLWGVEAVALPKITVPLPAFPVPFNPPWVHLTGLRLADRDFGVQGPVDVFLGADVFSRIILHGRQSGPSGTPYALETCFGWVLTGKTHLRYPRQPGASCFSSISRIRNTHIVRNMSVLRTLDNSRLRRCGTDNHLEASMMEMHNRHLKPQQVPQVLASQ